MVHETTVQFVLNGQPLALPALPQHSLLQMLRAAGAWEVKCACAEGDCGACTVLLDGQAVKSCLVPALSCAGRQVETIAGLGQHDALTQRLQEAFVNQGAVQCGFCSPAMVITARDYLAGGGSARREDIRRAISGNLCRCTGYEKIIRAIQQVAQEYQAEEGITCPTTV